MWRFEKSFIRFGGYEAPSTEDINVDEGVLEIQGGNAEADFQAIQEIRLPDTLCLRARLSPVPFSNDPVSVQLSIDEYELAPCSLYASPPAHSCCGIELTYRDLGSYVLNGERFWFHGVQEGNMRIEFQAPPDCIYTKFFAHEKTDRHELVQTGEGGHLTTTPPGTDQTVLHPYGGIWTPGQDLDRSGILFYEMIQDEDERTGLNIGTRELWEQASTPTVLHPGISGEDLMTLAEALNQGCARIDVHLDAQTAVYCSVSYHRVGDDLIDIIFLPTQ